MTLDEFYRALAQTPRRWQLEGGQIRISLEPSDRPWIDHDCADSQCPWSYVSLNFQKTSEEPMIDSIYSLEGIFSAADNREDHDPAIRARLLEACGLVEFTEGDPGDEN